MEFEAAAFTHAYNARAHEYVQSLGSVAQMEPCDVALIESWGARATGPILDAGCGPGHWTHLLSQVNADVIGIDLAAEFVESARRRFPGTRFETMDMARTEFPDRSFSAILLWYSMIHLDRRSLQDAMERVVDLVQDEGSLLLGFFVGPAWEPIPHAVATAFWWKLDDVLALLHTLGLQVLEVHTRVSTRHRDHAAVVASKSSSKS